MNDLSNNVSLLLIAMQAQARFNSMTPEERAHHLAEQRISFAWGNDVEGTGTIEQTREAARSLAARTERKG